MKYKLNVNKKYKKITGILILILALPLTLILVRLNQDLRSSAASPDKLEAEAGVLSSSGVSKVGDSGASGGQYVRFDTTLEPSPTLSPIPNGGDVVGTGITMTSLSNTRIGYSGFTHGSFRFKAKRSSTVEGLRIYMVAGGCDGGYAKGDGGMFKWTILPDNENGLPDLNANPYSSYSDTSSIGCSSQNAGYFINLNGIKPITAGKFYHIVAENIHPDPLNNYFSMNSVFVSGGTPNPYSPAYPDNENSHYYKSGSNWIYRAGHLPIYDLTFTDGSHQGIGYIEISHVSSGGGPSIVGQIGGSNIIRERFTYSGPDKSISSANIRVGKVSGSGTITISLKDGTNTLRQTAISGGQIPTITANNLGIGSKWFGNSFTPLTLKNGQSYIFEISAPSGSDYRMWPIRKGKSYGYDSSTYFNGLLEYSTNGGASWAPLGGHSGGQRPYEYDLQFYLK